MTSDLPPAAKLAELHAQDLPRALIGALSELLDSTRLIAAAISRCRAARCERGRARRNGPRARSWGT